MPLHEDDPLDRRQRRVAEHEFPLRLLQLDQNLPSIRRRVGPLKLFLEFGEFPALGIHVESALLIPDHHVPVLLNDHRERILYSVSAEGSQPPKKKTVAMIDCCCVPLAKSQLCQCPVYQFVQVLWLDFVPHQGHPCSLKCQRFTCQLRNAHGKVTDQAKVDLLSCGGYDHFMDIVYELAQLDREN